MQWPRCEGVSRRTGGRCSHQSTCRVPNTLAAHLVCDGDYYQVHGRPVHLCRGHADSWWSRRRRLLSIKLIEGGYLSPYNRYGYGSIVTAHERIDFARKVTIPRAWGATQCEGRVPEAVRAALFPRQSAIINHQSSIE